MWAVCGTPGCDNQYRPVDVGDLSYVDIEGDTQTMDVVCGVCGEEITELVDTPNAPRGGV